MDEFEGFPLTPDDRRFQARLTRSRDPPRPVGTVGFLDPGPTPASRAAGRLLRMYMRRPVPPPVRLGRPTPPAVARGAFVFAAAGVLPIGLIYCLVCRPDLRGRRLRLRLVNPDDVRRTVWSKVTRPADLLRRLRV